MSQARNANRPADLEDDPAAAADAKQGRPRAGHVGAKPGSICWPLLVRAGRFVMFMACLQVGVNKLTNWLN